LRVAIWTDPDRTQTGSGVVAASIQRIGPELSCQKKALLVRGLGAILSFVHWQDVVAALFPDGHSITERGDLQIRGRSLGVLACVHAVCVGCTETPPRTLPEAPAPVSVAHEARPEAPKLAPADVTPSDAAAPPVDAPPSALLPGAEAELSPALLAADGAALPQTHDLPRSDSAGFRWRLERLVEAIASDDAERALPAFFPRVAYEHVKAIAEPARDWQQRLVRAFERDVHEYHRLLGGDAAGAQLVGLVSTGRTPRWMEPGSEGNRLGYYRMTRVQLRVRLLSGAERDLDLTSLISWRGEWYVVHLHGFG
jgi:hypothetical protein